MQVILFDPPLRWHVTSEHGKAPYLVDLGEYEGNGQCDCKHFRCKLEPKLRDGEKSKLLMCKHIREARHHLANLIVQRFIDDERKARATGFRNAFESRGRC